MLTTAEGAMGVSGAAFTVTLEDTTEMHVPLNTVNVYAPAVRPLKVPEVPEPDKVAPPMAVTVQLPELGKPLNFTEPVLVKQVGCKPILADGAVGDAG